MKKIFFMLFALQFTINVNAQPMYLNAVNAAIGDTSFIVKYGRKPCAYDNYKNRIIVHLEYVLEQLQNKNTFLNSTPTVNRKKALAYLEEYIKIGKFPRNRKYLTETRPCFIDTITGNICAVGYLIAQTEGIEIAQKINQKYQYEYIQNVAMPEITTWIQKYGFTLQECAMIQPSYNGWPGHEPLTPQQIKEQNERIRKQKLLDEKFRKKLKADELKMKTKKNSLLKLLQDKTFTICVQNYDYCSDSTREKCPIETHRFYFHDSVVETSIAIINYNKTIKQFQYLIDDNKKYNEKFPQDYDRTKFIYNAENSCSCANTNCDTILSGTYFSDFYFKNNTWYWKPKYSTIEINLKNTNKNNSYFFEQYILENNVIKWNLIK